MLSCIKIPWKVQRILCRLRAQWCFETPMHYTTTRFRKRIVAILQAHHVPDNFTLEWFLRTSVVYMRVSLFHRYFYMGSTNLDIFEHIVRVNWDWYWQVGPLPYHPSTCHYGVTFQMTPCLRTFAICCLVSPSFIVFIFRLFTTHAHPLSMSRTKHGASFVQFSAVFEIVVSR